MRDAKPWVGAQFILVRQIKYQKTYQWYGRWVGDTKLPEGIPESELGKCVKVRI